MPFLLVTATLAAGLQGRWAGWLESPGSISAIRLDITGSSDSKMIMNIFGEETVHPLEDLRTTSDDIAFATKIFGDLFRFTGRLGPEDIIEGKLEFTSRRTLYTGTWRVRRFDDTALKKVNSPVTPSGRNEFPSPTGEYPIGRRTYYWTDESRPEPLTDDLADHRVMFVQVWYPARKVNSSPAALHT